jgi:hypothetical protein
MRKWGGGKILPLGTRKNPAHVHTHTFRHYTSYFSPNTSKQVLTAYRCISGRPVLSVVDHAPDYERSDTRLPHTQMHIVLARLLASSRRVEDGLHMIVSTHCTVLKRS